MSQTTALRLLCHLAVFSVFCAAAVHSDAKEVVLRNKDGKSLSVQMITCQGDKLTVLRSSDKKQFEISISQLDQASRAEVDAWLAAGGGLSERFEVEVRSGKTRRKAGTEDFDDKNVNIDPLIVVKNPQPNIRTRTAKITAVLLGRPINERNAYYVFSTESFSLPSLDGTKETAFQMKKVSRNYDDRGYAKFGARYLGWVVLIHDPDDGRIIHCQSVPTPLAEKFGSSLLRLKANGVYDENLRPLDHVRVYD